MVERRRIGLIIPDSEVWTGGAYYLANLIQALNQQPDLTKPQLVIFFRNSNDISLIAETGYPYLSFHNLLFEYGNIARLINRISWKLWRRNVFERKHPAAMAELVFP